LSDIPPNGFATAISYDEIADLGDRRSGVQVPPPTLA
jgi:hypothetical protein